MSGEQQTTGAKPTSTDAIAAATGTPWDTWLERLESQGASRLGHTDLARGIADQLEGAVPNSGWWGQMIAVAYEQHIGRRKPGQSCAGDFQVSASATVSMPRAQAAEAFAAYMAQSAVKEGAVDGVPLEREPVLKGTERAHYWRAALADGTRVSVSITDKAPAKDGTPKTVIGLGHEKIESEEDADRWRAFWKPLMKAMPRTA